jgi:drug/metabolite transporter (DMT)-like permease
MWSLGSVASSRLPMPANTFAATAWEMLIGGAVMFPLGVATAGSPSPSTASVLALVYLITFGSVVGFTAYTWLLANAPLATVSTYAYVNPVVAIILGVLFRNEHLSPSVLIGAAVIVGAVAVVVGKEPPAATQPEEGVR